MKRPDKHTFADFMANKLNKALSDGAKKGRVHRSGNCTCNSCNESFTGNNEVEPVCPKCDSKDVSIVFGI